MNPLDINPRGRDFSAHAIEWLRNKYNFLKCPSSIYDRDENQPIAFKTGSFPGQDGSFIEVDLNFYSDGFVADTRSSTKDSDAFLEDLLNSLAHDFGLVYTPEMVRKKLYVSEINIRLKKPLNNVNPRMQTFIQKIMSMTGEEDIKTMEWAGLGFWWDPASASAQSNFQLERVIGIPFSEQRYYSRAPLHTADHLQLLEEFEKIILAA